MHEVIGLTKDLEYLNGIIKLTVMQDRFTILLQGEVGTGKTHLAQYIHNISNREGRFIAIDCGTLQKDLLESKLFGYKKGSFTGATSDREGLIKSADKGTLFLDEIQNLTLEAQEALLQVLAEKKFFPLGSNSPVIVDINLICATNINLEKAMEEGIFRKDLYSRISILPLVVLPLNQRKNDIKDLAKYFLSKKSKNKMQFTDSALKKIQQLEFKDNVRGLSHLIERIVIFNHGLTEISESEVIDAFECNLAKIGQKNDIVELIIKAIDLGIEPWEYNCIWYKNILREHGNAREASRKTGIHYQKFYRSNEAIEKIKDFDNKQRFLTPIIKLNMTPEEFKIKSICTILKFYDGNVSLAVKNSPFKKNQFYKYAVSN